MEKIPCSVGILTYNSEKNLRRVLDSVKDFSDIIVSDGGSSDSTLQIAREYGCTIIDQYTKHHPGPDAYHPIEDFARERNQLISVAKEDWYLWVDSDEYISKELHEEIRAICSSAGDIDYFAYEIPIAQQSPDGSKTYRGWKQVYQIRFFNLKAGGRFERAMHERYVFDVEKFKTGRLKGVWYVPLSKPDFKSYSRAVNYRLGVMIRARPPTSFLDYLFVGIFQPIKRVAGSLYRIIMMRIKYKRDEVFPLFYFRNQFYSQWVIFKLFTKLYFSEKK